MRFGVVGGRQSDGRRVVAAVALFAAAVASLGSTAAADGRVERPAADPEQALSPDQLARSVVKIFAVTGDGLLWSGSGTVVSADGLVLTNAHVATGDVPFDMHVAVTESTDAPPTVRYRAELVSADQALDLALIRIVADLDGAPYQAGTIPPIPIGNSDNIQLGDELLILGYPGIGGDTITFTTGQVSGFTGSPALGNRAWIKTDATIAGGNSGGLAANTAGELVGVPTQASAGDDVEFLDCRPVQDTNENGELDEGDTCVPIGGFLNGVRPVNHVRAMLEAAQTGAAYQPIGANPPENFDVGNVDFEQLLLAGQGDTRPETGTVWLPGGATDLCAWWNYAGMVDGVAWDAIWSLDGEAQDGVSSVGDSWTGGVEGQYQYCVSGTPLPDGIWDLALNVEGTLLGGVFAAVGDSFQPVPFTFTNGSANDVCFVNMSPTVSKFWGADWLGPEQIVTPGTSVTFDLPPTAYDLRGLDCDGNVLFQDVVQLQAAATYTYHQGQAVPPTAPPTTVEASTTTVAPPTTVTPTPGGLTTEIDTAGGPQPFTCGDIVAAVEGPDSTCADAQRIFDAIVTSNAAAFNSYVYDADLGFFSTTEVNVPETAYVGLAACVYVAGGSTFADYDAFVREAFTASSTADTQRAWDAAAQTLCPFLVSG